MINILEPDHDEPTGASLTLFSEEPQETHVDEPKITPQVTIPTETNTYLVPLQVSLKPRRILVLLTDKLNGKAVATCAVFHPR